MAAFSATASYGLWRSILAGLCPEPQGACTQAAGAASQRIGVDAKNSEAGRKSVFGRHSTQSSIAPEGTQKIRRYKALVVDTAVYATAEIVYAQAAMPFQVPEYPARRPYTAQTACEARRL